MSSLSQIASQKLVTPASRWSERLLSVAVRFVAPPLLAALIFRCLIVPPSLARDPLSRLAGRLGHQYPLVIFVASTVVLMGVARYAWQTFWTPRVSSVPPFGALRFGRFRDISYTVLMALAAAAAALALRSYVFESHRVLSLSMLPSLAVGDQVLVNKVAYGWRHSIGLGVSTTVAPRRGQLIVFNFVDEGGSRTRLLKRVIGVAGDRIKMLGNTPNINGWNVPFCDVGPYANLIEQQQVIGRLVVEFLESEWYVTLHTVTAREPFLEEYAVEAGELFVLGDHRSESIDSRAWNLGKGGGVPVGAIEGRVDRFLVGTTRSGAGDFTRLLQAPERQLNIEGIDTSALTESIRKCLARRPANTVPPLPPEIAVASH